jgi:hypothetical protein
MLPVLVSHFGLVYFNNRIEALPEALQHFGMIASPSFMIISGLTLGLLCTIRPERAGDFRNKIIDRGLFLLTIGHLAVIGAHLLYQSSYRWLFITDAVGFNMIVGSVLIVRLHARARLAVSGILYAASWAAYIWWEPLDRWARLFKDTFVGPPPGDGFYVHCFPLLPWFALYLASTALGERIGRSLLRDDHEDVTRTLGTVGLGGICVAGFLAFWGLVLPIEGSDRVAMLGSIFQKLPPSPAYLAFFGGVGVALISAFYVVEQRGVARRLLEMSSRIGQSSLFVFVLQFYVFYLGLPLLDLQLGMFWPAYLALSIALILTLALWYYRRGYRRYITVGYPLWKPAFNFVDARVHRLHTSVGILAAMLWSGRH